MDEEREVFNRACGRDALRLVQCEKGSNLFYLQDTDLGEQKIFVSIWNLREMLKAAEKAIKE